MFHPVVFNLGAVSAATFLLAVLSGCEAGVEEGVLPEGPPQGAVVALDFTTEGRLLKAYQHALYQSEDGGTQWRPFPLPVVVQRGGIAAVAASADPGGGLYIAGLGMGILRSVDAGRTWVALDQGLPSREVVAFAAHAGRPKTLYAYIPDQGIYRSEDAGETWAHMDGGPGSPIRRLFHSDMKGSMQTGWLFAATPDGVHRSMDCFCGWRPTGRLPAGKVFDVAYDPRRPERVYTATASGLFRSEDGGESWAATTVKGSVRTSLAVDTSGALYATTGDGSLFRSSDQGRSWESVGG